MFYLIEIWVNIGSGNSLLPDGTKPLQQATTTLFVKSSIMNISHFEKKKIWYFVLLSYLTAYLQQDVMWCMEKKC